MLHVFPSQRAILFLSRVSRLPWVSRFSRAQGIPTLLLWAKTLAKIMGLAMFKGHFGTGLDLRLDRPSRNKIRLNVLIVLKWDTCLKRLDTNTPT